MCEASTSSVQPVNEQFYLLEERGKASRVPALDPVWCVRKLSSRSYRAYSAEEDFSRDVFLEISKEIIRFCKHLLKLEYHIFWSHVLYCNQSVLSVLDSYLINCPRPTEQYLMRRSFGNTKKVEVAKVQSTLHRLVYLIFLRLSKHLESSNDYMSPDFYAKKIYDAGYFSPGRLWDLISIFCKFDELECFVRHLFAIQPKLFEDFIDYIWECCRKFLCGAANFLGKKRYEVEDEVLLCVDLVYGLNCLFEVFPDVLPLLDARGFKDLLPAVYEYVVPRLLYQLYSRHQRGFFEDSSGAFGYIAKTLCALYRQLTEHDSETNGHHFTNNIRVLSHTHCRFLVMYNKIYPIDKHLRRLQNSGTVIIDDATIEELCTLVDVGRAKAREFLENLFAGAKQRRFANTTQAHRHAKRVGDANCPPDGSVQRLIMDVRAALNNKADVSSREIETVLWAVNYDLNSAVNVIRKRFIAAGVQETLEGLSAPEKRNLMIWEPAVDEEACVIDMAWLNRCRLVHNIRQDLLKEPKYEDEYDDTHDALWAGRP